ncbi:uncharacterized protein MONBRDRAFT_22930 [Monosiga brevicollis MX1]|uniref:RING-type E3 ubiquitin transferase n=1 Tax=Monosiga brevicollis TaxID=81824 RepID=A9USH6_MONBE|nr:uncharacterized protein MONBRDRAFT_22930 [Monosiga brevicollis MX1]EDQ91783.1 predicted protein [Monosiga brevicollis MX1]|eukprot:XP_001743069.1 hypothetical protein [Monosiga brevicollis MX1]
MQSSEDEAFARALQAEEYERSCASTADAKLAEELQAQAYEEAGLSAASAVVSARPLSAVSADEKLAEALQAQEYEEAADIDRALEENNYEALLALDDDNVRIGIDDPDAVSFLTSKALEEECSICLDTMAGSTAVRLLLCHHGFHDECIREHFKTSQVCPVCMSDLRELAAK